MTDISKIQPGADQAADAQDEQVLQGACTHCGKQQFVPKCTAQEDADAEATKLCDCPAATKARKKAEKAAKQEDDLEPREERMEKANAKIDELFGAGGAAEDGEDPCGETVLDHLKAAVELLIDKEVKRVSITIDDNTVAVMFKKQNGRISIERTDKDSEKAEF